MGQTTEKTARINVWINANEAKGSYKALSAEAKKLRNEIAMLTPGTAAFIEKSKQLKIVTREMNKVNAAIKGTKFSMGKMAEGFNKYFALMTAGIASITGVIFGIKNMIQKNAELEDSFADVQKTTGLTRDEVKSLYQDLKSINTRTTRKELLELATVAGKLGIEGRGNILGFVKAADKIKVALASDLGENSEDAINTIGKLVDIFKLKDKYGIEDAMLKVGSAINSLGAASAASEANIVEFMKRLGGVAPNAKMSIDQVAGLGATLDSLGQTSEVSGTAMSQFIIGMFKKTPEFAKLAGMEVKEFSDLLNTDANAALIKVLKCLKGNNAGMQEMSKNMDGLGLDGARAVSVIGVLANNIEMLEKQQKLSNEEFVKGTSLTEEFNIKNETLGASLAIVGKKLMGAFVNGNVMKGLSSIVSKIREWVEVPLSVEIEKERQEVNSLAMALLNFNQPAELRNQLYKELLEKAPGVLNGIDKERISLAKLEANLKSYNEEIIKKIALKSKEEAITTLNTEAATNFNIARDKEKAVLANINKLKESLIKKDGKLKLSIENTTGLYKMGAISIEEYWEKIKALSNQFGFLNASTTTIGYEKDFEKYVKALATYEGATIKAREAVKDLAEFQKELGITLNEATATTETKEVIPEGTEKLIEGVLMVFTNGKWVKKKIPGADPDDLKKVLDDKLRLQYVYFENAKKLYQEYFKGIGDEAIDLGTHLEDLQLKAAEAGVMALEDMGTTSETLVQKIQEFADTTLNNIENTFSTVSTILGQLSAISAEGSKRQRDLAYAEALINALSASIKAFSAALSIPVVGPFLAPIAAASAFAYGNRQANKIKNTPLPDGKKSGGFTGPGDINEVAGVVHRSEWVAPAWQVRSPVYGPQIRMLEEVRKRGHKEGGYASEIPISTATGAGGSGVDNALAMQTYEMLKLIKERLESPVPAVAYYGQDEVTKIRDNMDTMDVIENKSLK